MKLKDLSLHTALTKWSHEVRSPYTSAFGLLSILEDELDSENSAEKREYFGKLSLTVFRIFSVSDLVLEFARLENADIILSCTKIKPYYELNYLTENFLSRQRDLKTKVIIKSFDNDIEIEHDSLFFERLFISLLKSLSEITNEIIMEIKPENILAGKTGIEIRGLTKKRDSMLLFSFIDGEIDNYFEKTKFNITFGLGMLIFEKYIDKLKLDYRINIINETEFIIKVFYNK